MGKCKDESHMGSANFWGPWSQGEQQAPEQVKSPQVKRRSGSGNHQNQKDGDERKSSKPLYKPLNTAVGKMANKTL